MNPSNQMTPQDLEMIDRFLLREMSEEELINFQNRLVADDAFNTSYLDMKALFGQINESSLKERMEVYHQKLTLLPQRRIVNFPSLRWLAVAAVLLIAFGFWWLNFANPESRLYAGYYKQDPGLISAMSATDHYDFEKAMVEYKTGDYDAAIQTWQQQLVTQPANDTLNYFIAMAWLGKKDVVRSIPYLQLVTSQENSYFYNDAQWFLGLAYLKAGKKEQAIKYISKSNHAGKEKLLSQLGVK